MTKRHTIYIAYLLCLSCFISCKKASEQTAIEHRVWLNPDVKLEENFSIVLDMTIPQDDVFKVYYTEDPSQGFSEKRTVTTNVRGRNKNQQVTFNFPNTAKPKKLRIDFGLNKNQNSFKFNSIVLKNADNKLVVLPDSFSENFRIFNNNLVFDSIKGRLSVVKKPNKKYLPTIISKELLNNKLSNWYKEKNINP
jgi:hypothetical protein